jgi:hypothetical protein
MTTLSPNTGRSAVPKWVWVVVAVAGVLVAGCSDDDDPTTAPPPSQTLPSSTGDRCDDPVGDLTLGTASAPRADPPGVDLVEAVADLDDDQLVVTITTAGAIDSAPSPSFIVGQGLPFEPFSFEIRLVRDDATGSWATTVITWPQVEQQRAIAVQPTVEGATITFTVPSSELPPLANYLTFGSSSRLPDGTGIVIDDCSSLSQAATTTTA